MTAVTFPGARIGHWFRARFPTSWKRMTSTLELTRPGAAPQTEQRPPSSSSRRDPWFDNAKMLLVTLVVVGHSWVLLPEETLARNWFYDFLYLWHMPAFVIVTGYLSRSFTWSRRNLTKLVTVVAIPYVVFEAAMSAFRVRVGGEEGIDRLFLEPHWPMWFLAVMFLWRLATPLLKAVPAPLGVAVVISLLGGLFEGDVLDLGRALGMLPFFVLGLVARRERLDLLRSAPARVAAAGSLAVAFLLAPFIDGRLRTEWMYWRSSYADLDATFASGSLVRLGLLAVGALLALSALALVPRRGGWFTRLGAATMVVYLFHGFLVKAAEYAGLLDWASAQPWLGLVTTAAAAVVLALALAAPPVSRRLNVLVDPVGTHQERSRARRSHEARPEARSEDARSDRWVRAG
jgi:fucose 4-O-acetylase-like acetyltransferase